ncbi:hypothetical protein QEH53_11450 [Pelagicoccus sp. SDUM812002]|nr:hypothetical protein [Pelagicoccus sp. SDUM812002]MDQ8186206.1 hypothetical protein [Pelagicoccus sp. SDUM812002]
MQLDSVSSEQFARRVYLLEPGGNHLGGASAVYRSLASTRLRFLDRLYSKSHTFAAISETVYAFVARHRSVFSELLGALLPKKA